MTALAMYRLPYADHYTLAAQTEGKPEELRSIQELDGRSGFVIAPFRVSLLRRTRLSFAFHHRGGECLTPSVLPRHAASGVSP